MSELIVVTVIVAAEGGARVPKITSREELTKALNKLGALRSEQVHLDCMTCHSGQKQVLCALVFDLALPSCGTAHRLLFMHLRFASDSI